MSRYEDYSESKRTELLRLAEELAEIVAKFSIFYKLDPYDQAAIVQALDTATKRELDTIMKRRID